MAHQRTTSSAAADALKEPHSVSLKVLRLSRPSFATQHHLPLPSERSGLASDIKPRASLAYPSSLSGKGHDAFSISPLLLLPPAFGNAYVGETFACTLCANNELLADAESQRHVSSVRIEAEMKTPSVTIPLEVTFAKPVTATTGEEYGTSKKGADLGPEESLQGIVEFHLKEEGSHVLAVTISYMETGQTSGKMRSFRKLYQFVARGCLVVRTKIGALSDTTKHGWALEAQLENSGDDMIILDRVELIERPWCKATSLNWESGKAPEEVAEYPILSPGDVQQVCFLVEQTDEDDAGEVDETGRLVVGMLSIGWKGAMGNKGSLSTGWLGTRPR